MFSGPVGLRIAKAYSLVEYTFHFVIPCALLLYLYGKLIYKINFKKEGPDVTSVAIKKVN